MLFLGISLNVQQLRNRLDSNRMPLTVCLSLSQSVSIRYQPARPFKHNKRPRDDVFISTIKELPILLLSVTDKQKQKTVAHKKTRQLKHLQLQDFGTHLLLSSCSRRRKILPVQGHCDPRMIQKYNTRHMYSHKYTAL